MKSKKLLSLAVLPLLLSSCGGEEFNIYNQNIRYSTVIEPWNDVDKGSEEDPGTGLTVKQMFTQGFNYIDWTKWPSIPHGNVDEAINGFNKMVSEDFTKAYSAISIITDAKGTDPKKGTGTLNLGNQESIKVFFEIEKTSGNQTEYEFNNAEGNNVAKLTVTGINNHSITYSTLSVNRVICGQTITIKFSQPITEKEYTQMDMTFLAKFVS